MRTWISVHLPLLSLETIRPNWSEPGKHVVIQHERVLAMSAMAGHDGVRTGMRRIGVQTICPDAVLHEHDTAREQEALDGIALALLQYTPEVAPAEACSLLLDVSASLRAFNGRRALCRLVQASIRTLGFTARIGMAPTAQGAWLLAQGGRRRRVVRIESLACRLDALPCLLLPPLHPYAEWLSGIGCHSFAQLRRLPRAGLLRRTDSGVLEALDRAYGEAPELFEWVTAPKSFCVRLELPDRIEYAEAALFAARRLLLQMCGWLVAQQLAVSRILLQLEHERGRYAVPATPIDITLTAPAWREEHLTRLLKERLARLTLSAPMIAIRLEALQVAAMLPPTESLFPDPGGSPADYHRLLELLVARLGEQSVLAPAPHADHRPEVCNAWLPVASLKRTPAAAPVAGERPFWLLEQPIELMVREHRPVFRSQLKPVRGPERIESGWWDGALVLRDYFIYQEESSTCYWIYRERLGDQVYWFLQGFFA
jgi:protein ImuB